MQTLVNIYNGLKFLLQNHAWKVVAVFVIGGVSAVLGLIPGTENVSNVAGEQINSIKASIGTDLVSATTPE